MSFIFVCQENMFAIRDVKDIIEAIDIFKSKYDAGLLNDRFEVHPF